VIESCGTCRFFAPGLMGGDGQDRGRCRRHPPGIGAIDHFPGVRRASWCGDFQPHTVSDQHDVDPLRSPHEIVEKEVTARLMKKLLDALVEGNKPPPGKRWSDEQRLDAEIDELGEKDDQEDLFAPVPPKRTYKKRGLKKRRGRPPGKGKKHRAS
jgi:hypothetical protein